DGTLASTATVTNFGTIEATRSTGNGVFLGTNTPHGTVTNNGTIKATGTSGSGVELQAGGTVFNGASGSTAALISGAPGITVLGAAGTVINYGTIASSLNAAANFFAGGYVRNG